VKINDNYTLQLIKGYDKNYIKFSSFIIIKNNEWIDKGVNIDLTKANIIYTIKDWNIDKTIIDSVIEYVNNYEKNYNRKKREKMER